MVNFLMSSLPILAMCHYHTVFIQESRSLRIEAKQRWNVGRGKNGQKKEREPSIPCRVNR